MDFVQLTVHGLHLISSYPHITQQWACPRPTQDMSCYSSQAYNYDSLTWAIYSTGHQLGWPSRWLLVTLYSLRCRAVPHSMLGICCFLLKPPKSCWTEYVPFVQGDRAHPLAIKGSFILLTLYNSSVLVDPAADWFISGAGLLFSLKLSPTKSSQILKKISSAIISIWQNYKQLTPLPSPPSFKQLEGLQ